MIEFLVEVLFWLIKITGYYLSIGCIVAMTVVSLQILHPYKGDSEQPPEVSKKQQLKDLGYIVVHWGLILVLLIHLELSLNLKKEK